MTETCPWCRGNIEIGNYHITTGKAYCPEVYYAICDGPDECCNFFIAHENRANVMGRLSALREAREAEGE